MQQRRLLPFVLLAVLAAASGPLVAQDAQKPDEKPWPPPGVYELKKSEDVKAPRMLREVKPNYTGDAMRARIQGDVLLVCVVERDGKVGEIRVKRSLDSKFGLDNQAIKALKTWTFAPGTLNGEAVPVAVEVQFAFTLSDRRR
jgi:TonB family protein